MPFERIPYMEWAKTRQYRPFPEHVDLATSNMMPLAETLAELGIDPSNMPLTGPNSYGYAPLRAALAERYRVQPENILATQGTSMANFLLLATLLKPGDRVLMETPVYQCMTSPVLGLGARIVSFERRPEQGWKLDVAEVAEKAREAGAVAVFLANPNNPTGAFDEEGTMAELADALGPECFLIVDEIYREWLEGEQQQTSALLRPNVLATSSLTKVWGLSGLRAGWAIGSQDVIDRSMRAYDHMGVNNPFPSDWILAQLLADPALLERLRRESVARLADARSHVDSFLAGPGRERIETVMPSGGGYTTWMVTGLNGDEAAASLLASKGVVVVPGSFFGVPDHIRVAWTRPAEQVQAGLERFAEWLEERGGK